ncbi:MAG TPA: prepilin-type N-terminal cleavage/methylation domain-containing protein [Vicinamibacterales bacterium]|nr:prepilin-type N-terminal cleavage/methylation domain-containing protein [Vicinamibacterales bacterium]
MRERGFTLTELLISIALFATLAGMAVALMGTATQVMRANSQASRVSGLIQLARENAIRTQRDLELTFDDESNSVRVVRTEDGVASTVAEVSLEYQVQLRMLAEFAGTDTPDAFGNADAVDFGGAARLFFISEGSLVDEDSVPVNGTIFMGVTDQPLTGRAITITGTTARPRKYRWMGNTWAAQ